MKFYSFTILLHGSVWRTNKPLGIPYEWQLDIWQVLVSTVAVLAVTSHSSHCSDGETEANWVLVWSLLTHWASPVLHSPTTIFYPQIFCNTTTSHITHYSQANKYTQHVTTWHILPHWLNILLVWIKFRLKTPALVVTGRASLGTW